MQCSQKSCKPSFSNLSHYYGRSEVRIYVRTCTHRLLCCSVRFAILLSSFRASLQDVHAYDVGDKTVWVLWWLLLFGVSCCLLWGCGWVLYHPEIVWNKLAPDRRLDISSSRASIPSSTQEAPSRLVTNHFHFLRFPRPVSTLLGKRLCQTARRMDITASSLIRRRRGFDT